MNIRTRTMTEPPLIQDWLERQSAAAGFFPAHPQDGEAYRELSRDVDRRFTREQRGELAQLLEGGGPHARSRVDRFIREDGFVVTTGQQPVLFGGPLFVLYKALTAVALAHRLEALLDRPVLPVFWVASEDHDWEEARQVSLLDQQNQLRSPALEEREGPAAALHRIGLETPLAEGAEENRVPPGHGLEKALKLLLDSLPDSDFAGEWTGMISDAWQPGTTLPAAFTQALARLLGDDGLFFIQSHASLLRTLSRPILARELQDSQELGAALVERAQALESAGFTPQVPILEGATNVFLDAPESRERILVDPDGGFRLRSSNRNLSASEINGALQGEDGKWISPNVLLRPVVEAHILPTLAYVAGPGEASYLAQTAPLFEAHDVHRPLVYPRFSGDVLEGKVQKVLEKFDLDLEALATPHHELASRIARDEVPPSIRKEVGSFRGMLARHTAQLQDAVSDLDPTLGPPVLQLKSQGFAQLDEVEKKVTQALKRENQIALAQLSKAQDHLFPGGLPQERGMSFWYYLFRYGPTFLEEIRREVASRPNRIGAAARGAITAKSDPGLSQSPGR
jgi:bacillithiol synthase